MNDPKSMLASRLRAASRMTILLVGLTLSAAVRAQSVPPPADKSGADDESTVKLPSFDVVASQDVGYRASNSVSATGFNERIQDLPFTITALTQQYLTDINALDLADAAESVAGVKSAAPEFTGGLDRFLIRGFLQYPEHDGVFEGNQGNTNVDPIAVQRVEVAMGPSSLLYGIVAPGGTVNFISKRAEDTPSSTFSLKGGSYKFYQATMDINQPLIPDVLLFRLNAKYENGFEWQTPGEQRTKVIVPTITWKIFKNLSLRVNYEYYSRQETPFQNFLPYMLIGTPQSIVNSFNKTLGYPGPADAIANKVGLSLSPYGSIDVDRGYSDGATAAFNGTYLFPKSFNYASNNDYRNTNYRDLQTELTAKLNEHWNTKADFYYNKNDIIWNSTGISDVFIAPANSLVYANGAWSVAPSYAALSAAQQLQYNANFLTQFIQHPGSAFNQLQNGVAPPLILPQRDRLTDVWADNFTTQAEALGAYKFPIGTFQPLVGVYDTAERVGTFTANSTGTAAFPYTQTWDIDPASPTYYVNRNNDPTAAGITPAKTVTASGLSYDTTKSAYAVLNASLFGDKLQFVAGLRYNASEISTVNYLGTTNAAAYPQGLKTHYTTPQIGAGYKILPDLMFYVSYSQAYQLPTSLTNSTIGYNAAGTPIAVPTGTASPIIGKGYEAGFKTDFFDGRISSTLSAYEITEYNIQDGLTTTVTGPTGTAASVAYTFQGASQRSDGIEWSGTYSPTHNLQIVLNATDLYTRYNTEPVGYTYFLGAAPYNSSRYMSNLWLRYNITKDFWIGGGYKYTSKYLGSPSSLYFYLPAYLEWDGVIGYKWRWNKGEYSFTVNMQNITNQQIYPAQNSGPAWPRRFEAGVTAKY